MKQVMSMLLMAMMVIFIGACANDEAGAEAEATGEAASAAEQVPEVTFPSQPAAAVPAGTVMHYTCPKNCVGSGGPAKGKCPVCGTEYVHNDAFHANDQKPQTPPGAAPGAAPGATPPTIQQTPEPAQNAKGVWHYTCTKGHAGGAGEIKPCATCGAMLVHNQAYHQ